MVVMAIVFFILFGEYLFPFSRIQPHSPNVNCWVLSIIAARLGP